MEFVQQLEAWEPGHGPPEDGLRKEKAEQDLCLAELSYRDGVPTMELQSGGSGLTASPEYRIAHKNCSMSLPVAGRNELLSCWVY